MQLKIIKKNLYRWITALVLFEFNVLSGEASVFQFFFCVFHFFFFVLILSRRDINHLKLQEKNILFYFFNFSTDKKVKMLIKVRRNIDSFYIQNNQFIN